MKKILSLVLAIVLAASAFLAAPLQLPGLVVAASAEEATEPSEGGNAGGEGEAIPDPAGFLTYAFNSNSKSYAVTGYTGEQCDELVIPAEYEGKPVTSIADKAFEMNSNFKNIVLPDTIEYIGMESFRGTSIKKIDIPDSVTYIAPYAFDGCSALQTVKLSKNVKTIEYQTFSGCFNLTDIFLPVGLENIEDQAFSGCGKLGEIIIPDSVKHIGGMAFYSCTNLKSVKLPKSIDMIEYQLFMDCYNLTEIVIPDGVKTIRYNAFANCSKLEKITLPDSVEKIFDNAFDGTLVYTDKSNWEDGALYINNHLIAVDNTIPEMYRVKNGTVSIAQSAFKNAPHVGSVYLPKTIKSVDDYAFMSLGLAFIFYEGTVEEFNKINFNSNETYLEETIIILEADGVGKPNKVTTKSVSNVAGGLKVTWGAVANADLYLVWRRGAGNSDWQLLGITDQTSVVDTSAGHRQYWRYSVQAMNADDLSDFDYTGKYQKYVATPKLTGISNATNGIYFKWNAVSGASGYRVYRRASGSSTWTYLGTVKGTGYTDTGVKNANNKYYRYTVRAVVDGLYSGYEDFLYTKRVVNPKLISATNTSSGISVKWNAVSGTTGYYVYRKTAGSGWVKVGTCYGTSSTTFVDKTAKKGTTYTYTVRAAAGKTTSYFNSGISCKRK